MSSKKTSKFEQAKMFLLQLQNGAIKLTPEMLPLRVGAVSVKQFNDLVVNFESSAYKLELNENREIFLVEMATPSYGAVVALLQDHFRIQNGGVILRPPIKVQGATFHWSPATPGQLIAPDVSVFPRKNLVAAPRNPLPPECYERNPYARIICEVAISRSADDLQIKYQKWFQEQYVRWVLGIKIHEKRTTRNARGQYHRSMTAMLWQQGGNYNEWDFGTLQYGQRRAPTGCINAGLALYQISIPVADVFWDPPVNGGAVNVVGYVVAVPAGAGVVGDFFSIDLFEIQQLVLETQDNA